MTVVERQIAFETHATLVERAAHWLARDAGIVLTTISGPHREEQADVFAASRGGDETTVIECKQSRADFLADLDKPHRAVGVLALGNRRLYYTVAGLVKPEEVPEPWGLVYLTPSGNKTVKYARRVESNRKAEYGLMWTALYQIQRGYRPWKLP